MERDRCRNSLESRWMECYKMIKENLIRLDMGKKRTRKLDLNSGISGIR